MRAAVQDVHHRHGQQRCLDAAEIAVERRLLRCGRGARSGHRDGENRVRAQAALVRRAVELDHLAIDRALLARIHALQRRDRVRR